MIPRSALLPLIAAGFGGGPSFASSTTLTMDRLTGSHADRESGPPARSQGSVMTFPLLPHRTVLERRRMERRLKGLPDDDNDESGLFGEGPVPRGRRSMQPEHQQVGALYQGYGTHYVDLWVGTPPQRQTTIVDTGSGITAFPCSGCTDCGDSYHTDGYFIEADSSTFETLSCKECYRGRCSSMGGGVGVGGGSGEVCRISMSYQEGSSWSAYEGRDLAYAGGRHDRGVSDDDGGEAVSADGADPNFAAKFRFKLTFGCQVSLTGLFKTQLADGIMGMDNAGASFWAQMHSQKAIPEKKFSLCFTRQNLASREGTMAGALTLGGEDRRLHTSPMVLTKNVRSSGFYTVWLKKMYLRENGGDSAAYDPKAKAHLIVLDEASLNSGGVIVDSGTTDTYMNRRIGSAFKAIWLDIVHKPYSHEPVKLTAAQLEKLPTVLFQIEADGNSAVSDPEKVVGLAGALDPESPNDVVIAMPASHYMEYDPSEDRYVARLYLEEGSGSVLGANLMMGHDVTFDVDGGTIGWAESNCDYNHLIDGGSMGLILDSGAIEVETEGCGTNCIVGVALGIMGGLFVGIAAFVYIRRRRALSEAKAAHMTELNMQECEMEGFEHEIGVEENDDPNFDGHESQGPSIVGDDGLYMQTDQQDYDQDEGRNEYHSDPPGKYRDELGGYGDVPAESEYRRDQGGNGGGDGYNQGDGSFPGGTAGTSTYPRDEVDRTRPID